MLEPDSLSLRELARAPTAPHLEVVGGPEDGRIYVLRLGVTRIGRDPESQLKLSLDAKVAAHHARIAWQDGDYYLDRSGGPTALDGQVVSGRTRLVPGQAITIGDTCVVFRAPSRGDDD